MNNLEQITNFINPLYEDNHIIVAVKPPNIPTQADNTGDTSFFENIKDYIKLKYNKQGNVFLGLVHRLDRPVSGVMVFAKTSKAASRLSEAIRNRNFQKTYYCVVKGILLEKENTLENYLIKKTNKLGNIAMVVFENTKNAKKAILHYKVLKEDNIKNLSLLKIELENRYKIITESALEAAKKALKEGKSPVEAIFNNAIESLNRRYSIMEEVGTYLIKLVENNSSILTQCFGETIVGMMCRAAKKENKTFKAYCLETRPYFQGARLTSSCFYESGIDVTVITDNMAAYVMQKGAINIFTSAADTITRDGYIANKIGTLQAAILADKFEIPYYVAGIPDKDKNKGSDIVIEERDPELVLSYRGIPNTLKGVKGIYPSFDVTPPKLISAVVTDKGIYSPYNLEEYFETETRDFY